MELNNYEDVIKEAGEVLNAQHYDALRGSNCIHDLTLLLDQDSISDQEERKNAQKLLEELQKKEDKDKGGVEFLDL